MVLIMLIVALGLPPCDAQVQALFTVSMHEYYSALSSGHYIEYALHRICGALHRICMWYYKI